MTRTLLSSETQVGELSLSLLKRCTPGEQLARASTLKIKKKGGALLLLPGPLLTTLSFLFPSYIRNLGDGFLIIDQLQVEEQSSLKGFLLFFFFLNFS